jgi:hypothetical protein
VTLLLSVLAACATVGYAIHTLDRVASRALALAEARQAAAAATPAKVAIPADIAGWVDQESESWAKGQNKALVLEAYEDTQDWIVVRQRLGIA